MENKMNVNFEVSDITGKLGVLSTNLSNHLRFDLPSTVTDSDVAQMKGAAGKIVELFKDPKEFRSSINNALGGNFDSLHAMSERLGIPGGPSTVAVRCIIIIIISVAMLALTTRKDSPR
jgi:chromosome segregation ATPase